MGLDTGAVKAARANPDLRSGAADQLAGLAEVGRKIAEMAGVVNVRLFGPQPTPERAQPAGPLGPEASLETIFSDGIRSIKAAQSDAGGALQEILSRL